MNDELAQSNLHLIVPPEEQAQLAALGLDPTQYTMLTLPSNRIQMADGHASQGTMLVLTTFVPMGLLTERHVLLSGGGRNAHPLDGAVALMPAINLVVPISRLTDTSRASLEATVTAALGSGSPRKSGELMLPGEISGRVPVESDNEK